VRRPAVVLVAAVCFLSCGRPLPDAAWVRRVIDGDTVELMGARLVRYLGIDAPEVRRLEGERWVVDPEPMGREATEFNRRLVEGKRVRLEYDVQTHDRFGRLLAYVYLSAEGDRVTGAGEVMVNAELLRAGFAQPLTIPPNARYADRFRALTEEARRAQRGLWERR
jgi:micrococcal nuclease